MPFLTRQYRSDWRALGVSTPLNEGLEIGPLVGMANHSQIAPEPDLLEYLWC